MTITRATAASPDQELPRTYQNAKEAEYTATLAPCHEVPWLPLRLQAAAPEAAPSAVTRLRLPIVWPYM